MKYFGLYRGVVVDNDDSETDRPYLGRVQVQIPAVYGEVDDIEKLPWAWTCVPTLFGSQEDQAEDSDELSTGGFVALPAIDSRVWVQFEQGDPQHPVVMGAWIGDSKSMPSQARSSTTGASYPNIYMMKFPFGPSVYLRVHGDEMFEICLADLKIQLKKAEGSNNQKILISAADSDIELSCPNGTLTMDATEIVATAKTLLKLVSGEWELNDQEETVVKTEGDVQVWASRDIKTLSTEKTIIQTSRDGELQAASPKASGFDRHGQFGEGDTS